MRILALCSLLFLCVAGFIPPAVSAFASADIELNEEEQALVDRTKNGEPIKIGIIPHSFPLSDCPPGASDYVGIHIEMLGLISEISGLQFEYRRIPLEEKTPYQSLKDKNLDLVAGTIKLDSFIENTELILSDRLCDGSAICIAKQGSTPSNPVTGKVAVMSGYQAGSEFAQSLFPKYEIALYPSNQDVLAAVRKGESDLAIISRYVGIYELQNPFNEGLIELTPYRTEKDSCVMGLNTNENSVTISVINKALSAIGEDGYNYIQMNFSISHPYNPTILEFMYRYRYLLMIAAAAFICLLLLTLRLFYTQKEHKRLSLDPLTGAFSEAGFELAAAKIIAKTTKPMFITDFDICRFSSYNELNGKDHGDELLKNIVKIVRTFLSEQDVICRAYADHFKVLSCKDSLENLSLDIREAVKHFNQKALSTISLSFGVYPIKDNTVPISKMLAFAAMAKKHVKNDSDKFIGVFDEALLSRSVNEARMTSAFDGAVANKEFIAYYQPKFDSASKTVIGAEALVRWKAADGSLIPPYQFIELFEKSGQIQQLDFYMLELVCVFLNSLKSKGLSQVPIAVNFSRVHLYSGEFGKELSKIVEYHKIPKNLIEIECTETTMLNNIDETRDILGKLQEQGFSIAMDDFGSAYSSLNTLCSIPLDVLKLDGGFLRGTLSNEKEKAKIIISSVISLAHNLSLKVVAEGVETIEQYEFLKSLDCDFIQGYYFSKPLEEEHFLALLTRAAESDKDV